MSKQSQYNQSRRTFIKSAAYSLALTAGGLHSVTSAADKLIKNKVLAGSALPTCDISLKPNQMIGTEKLSLTNHTNRDVRFDSISGIGLEDVNKYLTVKVNKLGKHEYQGAVVLAPGEQLSFVVSALSCDNYGNANSNNIFIPKVLAGKLRVESDHPDFNGFIPLTVFETA